MPKKKGGKSKEGSAFFKRYEGALDAGYPKDEAAAIAHSKQESLNRAAAKLRESVFPHLRRRK